MPGLSLLDVENAEGISVLIKSIKYKFVYHANSWKYVVIPITCFALFKLYNYLSSYFSLFVIII